MNKEIRRVFVEKKEGFNVEGLHLLKEFKETLEVKNLVDVRVVNRYDISLEDFEQFEMIKRTVLSEPNADDIYEGEFRLENDEKVIPVEYLPGQYDQRADWASQGIRIITHGKDVKLKVARLIVLKGDISEQEFEAVKKYLINPVDSREASLKMPESLQDELVEVEDVEVVSGFIDFNKEELVRYKNENAFAMSDDDVLFIQEYYKEDEKRNPTITELKVIDTYWSDHCRHTTFLTEITDVEIEEGRYAGDIKKTFEDYLKTRKEIYGDQKRAITLMDMAVINMKLEKKNGNLKDLDQSEEINACSVNIDVDVNGKNEKWLLMFKNETHNHPTEIEPFGGAATCLGGAIRDPLSGRSYVYQSMRVTGASEPRKPIKETMSGKLPQRKISREAAKGFSSYGNQIGLATGQVTEIYDDGYVAKRMEIGAVIGAAPKENVVREVPVKGDVILLIGGRTGRDGCGGATGSSKVHTEESILKSGAEVQKGNPPEERKIQRLFRNPEVAKMIKRCNDFGAGGVSVAIGELADSLEIDLDKVPKKYEGLDGTELAISESQERMAVVVDKSDVEKFLAYANEENIEGTAVAKVTDTGRLVMKWRGKAVLDLSRKFLNSNGAKQYAKVMVKSPAETGCFEKTSVETGSFREKTTDVFKDLNVCSQQGLSEMFDSTIGAATVVMPFGGKYMVTEPEGMVAKIPVTHGETTTCSLMSFGYQPEIFKWSPYHGGIYSVVESVAKIVAMGGDFRKIRFSFQEYFERLGQDPARWGKPFSALLGAYQAQKAFSLAAIGGKDSMSGSFNDIDVPPTLVSFAVACDNVANIITPEFKGVGSKVYLAEVDRNKKEVPDFEEIKGLYQKIKELIDCKVITSAKTLAKGGVIEAVGKMAFGNGIGFKFDPGFSEDKLFEFNIGAMMLEIPSELEQEFEAAIKGLKVCFAGTTDKSAEIVFGDESILLEALVKTWKNPLSKIFPETEEKELEVKEVSWTKGSVAKPRKKIARPRVLIPVFPGTNCEYDTAKVFEKAGAQVDTFVFRNLTASDIDSSLDELIKRIDNSQILMFPGGFSAGDEPDGSGKFIATIFRNGYVKESVTNLLESRDGLILGICNGFQALIKLGLLPYGQIRDISPEDPTLTFNHIGRHVSKIAMTKITSNLSPWFSQVEVGDVHMVPISHGEGRFVANQDVLERLEQNGQIATQYVDLKGNVASDGMFNPNGSEWAVEGITSPDGRVLGKMGHSERIGDGIYKNIIGEKDQKIFESGIKYFG